MSRVLTSRPLLLAWGMEQQRSSRRAAAAVALVVLISIIAFGIIVAASHEWTAMELGLVQSVNAAHAPVLDATALTVNVIFGPPVAAAVLIVLAIIVGVLRRSARWAIVFAVMASASWMAAEGIKLIVQRVRPDSAALNHVIVTQPTSFSFPSGHTAFVSAVGIALAVTLASRRTWRGFTLVGALAVAITAWSRVYLGVHYLSDVLAACASTAAAAVLIATFLVAFWSHWPALRPPHLSAVPSPTLKGIR